MSGLYLHIPFCRKACTYCDFHFSTALGGKERVLDAMRMELEQRMGEAQAPLQSVYFGGGTPSLLSSSEIGTFLSLAHKKGVEPNAEITIEANPDDISAEILSAWRSAGITRVSLGTQSFRDDRLQWMGRAHDATQALRSIDLIANAGFASWTIDLIYGLPGMSLAEWEEQIAIALEHGMPHLSAYCLTIEERTALHHQVKKGIITPANDEQQASQFEHLIKRMEEAGLVQYEISNFGKPGHFARHNSNYWKGVPYIGIGPSAHSFDGLNRRANVANNMRYVDSVLRNERYWEDEIMTPSQRANERLLVGLRTMWGVDLRTLGMELTNESERMITYHAEHGHLLIRDHHLVLTREGRNFADRIASDLFLP